MNANYLAFFVLFGFVVLLTGSTTIGPSTIQTTSTRPPPPPTPGPFIDLTSCDKMKGCYRNPPNCYPSTSCSQIVTWAISPDDPAAVRFEMATALTYQTEKIQFIALALSVDINSIMMNSSILVCAVNGTSSSATAYLAHNANHGSKPLPDDQFKIGVDMIHSEIESSYLMCVIDRKIAPSSLHSPGLVFPLYQSFIPAIAAGPADQNGIVQGHAFKQKLTKPITTTDFTNQTSVDVSLCGIAHGCLLSPAGCHSLSDCKQIVMWNILQSGDHVRFQLSTPRNFDYIAFGLANTSGVNGFMGNGSVLACAVNHTNSMIETFLSWNLEISGHYANLINDDPLHLGLKPVLTLANSDRLICVVDQVVHPQPGASFDLSQPWYPSWAAGPTKDGQLYYHGADKQGYGTKVVCTEAFSPSPSNVIDKDLFKKLHALFMAIGWMVCAACSMLTPRYLRKRWTTMKFFRIQLWMLIHQIFMIIGIVFVAAGFILILYVDDFLFVDPGPTYPDRLHPYFGVISTGLLFINPIVALFRCKPGHKKRPIFNWIHGLIGGVSFVLAAANLVIGGLMFNNYNGSLSIYAIIFWAGCHLLVELVYLAIMLFGDRRHRSADREPILANPENTNNSDTKSRLFELSTAVFVFYFILATGSAATVGGLVFKHLSDQ